MKLPLLYITPRADAPLAETEETFEGSPRSCRTNFMWLNWCPVDIVLWVLVLAMILLVVWRIFVHRSARHAASSTSSTVARQTADADGRELSSRADPMIMDPYHIPRPFNDSLICKDESFQAAPKPECILDDKKDGPSRPPGLTVEIPDARNFIHGGSATPSRSPGRQMNGADPFWVNYTAQFDCIPQPDSPPPAYVRSPRWDM